MKLPIIYYGNPLLRKHSEAISEVTDEIRQLVKDMIVTMDNSNGIGLSAIQIGKAIRLFVLRNYIEAKGGRWTLSEPFVYINPKIVKVSPETIVDIEACISLPGLRVHVERPTWILLEATDLEGNRFEEESFGHNARVRLHENDHLNGVLHIDRAPDQEKKLYAHKLKEIKKKYNQ